MGMAVALFSYSQAGRGWRKGASAARPTALVACERQGQPKAPRVPRPIMRSVITNSWLVAAARPVSATPIAAAARGAAGDPRGREGVVDLQAVTAAASDGGARGPRDRGATEAIAAARGRLTRARCQRAPLVAPSGGGEITTTVAAAGVNAFCRSSDVFKRKRMVDLLPLQE